MSTTAKQAYLSPSTGTLEISAVRSLQPTASIVLDLGIPNFTVFSIKFPIPSSDPLEFRQVASEALGVMLDEMAAFMISTGYKKEIIAKVYALALDCYKGISANDNPEKREKDPTIGSVRGEFLLPPEFINETQKCVVTASAKQIRRQPRQHRMEFVPERPLTPSKNDVLKAIKRYRFQSIKSQPYPLYLVVYDNMGKPKGTLSLGPGFHNELLKMQYKKKGGTGVASQHKTLSELLNLPVGSLSDGDLQEVLTKVDRNHPSVQGLVDEAVSRWSDESIDRALLSSKIKDFIQYDAGYRWLNQAWLWEIREKYKAIHRDSQTYSSFGDSKARDRLGYPQVVYHGTRFDDPFHGDRKGRVFFSSNPTVARWFAGGMSQGTGKPVVMRAYLKMSNPLEVDAGNIEAGHSPEAINRWWEQSVAGGHDGLIIRNIHESGYHGDNYIVSDRDQIISLGPMVPKEHSASKIENIQDIITEGGGKFVGIGDGDLVYFNNPHNPSTLVLDIHEVTPEAVRAKIQWSIDAYEAAAKRRDKRAGQWGERSYDGDSIHDILDRYRPRYDEVKGTREHLGFDEPVPDDRLPDLIAELNSMDLGTPDAMQDYLGVAVFLVTHGSDIPEDMRKCALGIAHELHGDTEGGNPGENTDRGYKLWKDPVGRKRELEREMAILEGDESKVASAFGVAKQGSFLREDEMVAWGQGKQDEYYARHPELGSPGKKLNLMVTEPDGTSVPLAKAVRADYDPDALIDPLTNLFGRLQPEYRERLKAVLKRPTERTWDNAYSIIISGSGKWLTLWQAVLAVDPTFPRTGPATDQHGKKLDGWRKVPSRETLIAALRYANPVKHDKEFNTDDIKFLESMGIKQADYTNEEGYWAGEGNAASGILPVCVTTGRICLAWRSAYVNEGDCWGTIGGAVKKGMQPGPSAKEELEEETGYNGGVSLHPAYVFHDKGGFKYFNYIGEVGVEFDLNPQDDSAWETESLEWGTYDEVQQLIDEDPHRFHRGLLLLFQNSGNLIQQVCNQAKRGKGKGNANKVKGNTDASTTGNAA
jgi:8-oxo-dGTP pyrophosphatase MutT (NUDIX family)